jgi:hypothetical protein
MLENYAFPLFNNSLIPQLGTVHLFFFLTVEVLLWDLKQVHLNPLVKWFYKWMKFNET